MAKGSFVISQMDRAQASAMWGERGYSVSHKHVGSRGRGRPSMMISFVHDGLVVTEWAREFAERVGLAQSTVDRRVKSGMTLEKVVSRAVAGETYREVIGDAAALPACGYELFKEVFWRGGASNWIRFAHPDGDGLIEQRFIEFVSDAAVSIETVSNRAKEGVIPFADLKVDLRKREQEEKLKETVVFVKASKPEQVVKEILSWPTLHRETNVAFVSPMFPAIQCDGRWCGVSAMGAQR